LIEGSCTRALGAIGQFGEGDLGRLKTLLLQRHAKRCGRCASYLDRMEAVMDGLARLGQMYAPDDFAEAVMGGFAPGGTDAEGHYEVKEHGRLNVALVAAAAGLGVGAAVALAIARWVTGREDEEILAPVSSG
jgi:hypothetical protein